MRNIQKGMKNGGADGYGSQDRRYQPAMAVPQPPVYVMVDNRNLKPISYGSDSKQISSQEYVNKAFVSNDASKV